MERPLDPEDDPACPAVTPMPMAVDAVFASMQLKGTMVDVVYVGGVSVLLCLLTCCGGVQHVACVTLCCFALHAIVPVHVAVAVTIPQIDPHRDVLVWCAYTLSCVCVSLSRVSFSLRFLRGCCYLQLGQPVLAAADMSTVLKLRGSQPHARYVRAQANLVMGQTTAAMSDLSQVG